MQKILRDAAQSLPDSASSAPALAAALEWGFEDFRWALRLQSPALKSLDDAPKTPAQIEGNESRAMGEELRRRGLLKESEPYFLKALDSNLLDYRVYLDLAMTYVAGGQFDKAREYLEKSLVHAPSEDDRSYACRLLGHLGECEGKDALAAEALRSAIEAQPHDPEGHFDYARFHARAGDAQRCLAELETAILGDTLFWFLAKSERDFSPIHSEILKLLAGLEEKVSRSAKDALEKANAAIREAEVAIAAAQSARDRARSDSVMPSMNLLDDARWNIDLARQRIGGGDFPAFADSRNPAERAGDIALRAQEKAVAELEFYRQRRVEKLKYAWSKVPREMALWPTLFVLIGGSGFSFGNMFLNGDTPVESARSGFMAGALIGLGLGILYGALQAYKRFR